MTTLLSILYKVTKNNLFDVLSHWCAAIFQKFFASYKRPLRYNELWCTKTYSLRHAQLWYLHTPKSTVCWEKTAIYDKLYFVCLIRCEKLNNHLEKLFMAKTRTAKTLWKAQRAEFKKKKFENHWFRLIQSELLKLKARTAVNVSNFLHFDGNANIFSLSKINHSRIVKRSLSFTLNRERIITVSVDLQIRIIKIITQLVRLSFAFVRLNPLL